MTVHDQYNTSLSRSKVIEADERTRGHLQTRQLQENCTSLTVGLLQHLVIALSKCAASILFVLSEARIFKRASHLLKMADKVKLSCKLFLSSSKTLLGACLALTC